MAVDGAQAAIWPLLSEFIAEQTGLHFPPERRSDLQRGVAAAAAEMGFKDSAAYAHWLLSRSLTRVQLHILASHLTVGETYFFRERETLDALAKDVLPELIRSRRGRDQRLRLWSAACSTGEEPYSLAILLRQLLPDWQDWRVTILATDINERFLTKASAGVYGEWSFRGSPSGFKQRYFTPTPDGRFRIAPEIRDCVRFTHMNLARDSFPSLLTDTNAMDVILCRNVLIYFTPSHARKLVESLGHALADEGWLAVSPCECSQELFSGFAAVNFPGSILYRKSGAEPLSSSGRMLASSPRADERATSAPHAMQQTAPVTADGFVHLSPPEPPADTTSEPPTPADPRAFALRARELANQGRLADALTWSERWVAADKVDSAAHYLHAMILAEMGEREAARRSLQRTVYLQPDFALGHFALGNLARADERAAEANRHFANAMHLLRRCSPDELLPESDGITAGRLVEIIAALSQEPV